MSFQSNATKKSVMCNGIITFTRFLVVDYLEKKGADDDNGSTFTLTKSELDLEELERWNKIVDNHAHGKDFDSLLEKIINSFFHRLRDEIINVPQKVVTCDDEIPAMLRSPPCSPRREIDENDEKAEKTEKAVKIEKEKEEEISSENSHSNTLECGNSKSQKSFDKEACLKLPTPQMPSVPDDATARERPFTANSNCSGYKIAPSLQRKRTPLKHKKYQSNKSPQPCTNHLITNTATNNNIPKVSSFRRAPQLMNMSFSVPRTPLHGHSKSKSNESWIPEDIRSRMVKRDLAVAMENFESKETINCQQQQNGGSSRSLGNISAEGIGEQQANSKQRRNLHSLERSLSKERYGIESRKPCGLCCVKFLPINLIMAVPLKAVLDIRDSWGDKFDPDGAQVRVNPNLRRAPACYNQTRVCAFCAQLFDRQQEMYRPSWEAKEAEKERARVKEEEERCKVMNDPLSQVERERVEEVNELTRALSVKTSMPPGTEECDGSLLLNGGEENVIVGTGSHGTKIRSFHSPMRRQSVKSLSKPHSS